MNTFVHRLVKGPVDRKSTGYDKGRAWRLLASYGPGAVTIVLLAVIAYLTNKGGYRREFSLTDTSLQHTYAGHERISFTMCCVYAGAIPAICIIFIASIWRRSFWDAHNGLLGLLLSLSLTTVFTQVVKICVGRPRPDLIDRCQPIANATNRAVYGLANAVDVCTTPLDSHKMVEGFRSFPSGHSSAAWSGLLFFSLYLCGKMHLFDRRGHTFKAWIAITPLIGATLIGVSRSMDYRHHAGDIIAGSILGAVIAYVTYHLYYPSLLSPHCHLPYSPRIPPTLPHDQLNSDDESSTAGRNGGQNNVSILPTHHYNQRSSRSYDSSQDPDSFDPHSPSDVPLKASPGVPHALGETAPRPSGAQQARSGTSKGYREVGRQS
ncbi:hypothetical protein JCM11251_000174 [Rhodosporidiobolus azoricus]